MIRKAPPRVSFKYQQVARRKRFVLLERIIMKSLQSSLVPKRTSKGGRASSWARRPSPGIGGREADDLSAEKTSRIAPTAGGSGKWEQVFQQLLLESGSGQGFLPQKQILPLLAEVPDHSSYQKLVFLLLERLLDSSVPGRLSTTSPWGASLRIDR